MFSSNLNVIKTLRPFHFGFSFWWAWIFLCLFSPTLFFDDGQFIDHIRIVRLSSMAASATMLAVFSLFASQTSRYLNSRVVSSIAGILLSCGTIIIVITTRFFAASDTLLAFGGLLTGLGLALFVVLWGEIFAGLERRAVETLIPAALLLAVILYFVFTNIPPSIALIAAILYPLAGSLSLSSAQKHSAETIRKQDGGPDIMPFFLKLVFVASCFAATFCFFREAIGPSSATEAESINALIFFFSGFVSFLFLLASLLLKKNIDTSILYKVALPFVVIGAFLFSVLNLENHAFASAIVMAGTRCSDIILWILLAEISRYKPFLSTRVFGIGFSFSQAGAVIGTTFGIFLTQRTDFVQTNMVAVVLLVLFVLVCATALLVSAKNPFSTENSSPDENLVTLLQEYGLSPREIEISLILAKGRTLPYIAEELHIAQSTVATHAKHIYEKTNVHNRQELLDFFEESHSTDQNS